MTQPFSKRSTGFTLIELLVVIAIIAILAAILFPVFSQVRENARQVTCISNEKQIGLAMTQYTQDADEKFPMLQYYDANGQPVDWYTAIYVYVKNGKVSASNGATYSYGQGGVWACPSFPAEQPSNYGINWQLCRNGSGTWASTQPGFVQKTAGLAQIDSPADKIMILEKGQAGDDGKGNIYAQAEFDPGESNWTTPIGPIVNNVPAKPSSHAELAYDYDAGSTLDQTWGTGPGDMPRFRHHQNCNSLFVDGHVKSIHRGQMDWYKNIYIPGLYADLEGSDAN